MMDRTISDPDTYYRLKGSCVGCRRVTWLCRRDRRCAQYATTAKRGYVATPIGYHAVTCPACKALGTCPAMREAEP